MSTAALCIAARDRLRSSLTNFYSTSAQKNANCRVMVNHHPTPSAGEEFIAIYGGNHRPRETWHQTVIEEQFGFVVAVTRRVALIPRDHRGEAGGYVEDAAFNIAWTSLEQRCREIVGFLDKNYTFMQEANALFNHQNGFSEPAYWIGTDPSPTEVGAEHFCASHVSVNREHYQLGGIPDADDVYGLLMHVRFDGAIRFQPNSEYDTAPA